MPRKRKSQKQNRTTNIPGADLLPPTVNTATPNTRLAQEEKATPKGRSDGPTREIQGIVKRHREQAPALVLHEPDHGANSNAWKQDSKTRGKAKFEKTGNNHVPVQRNPSSVPSTPNMTGVRLWIPTWAAVVASRRDKGETALDLRVDKKSKDIIHELRQKPEEGNPETEACPPPNLGHSTKLGTEKRVLREEKFQSLRKFSESFKVPGPIPRDLVPILAKGRLKQERIIAKIELAENTNEEAKPSNEEKTSGKLQHLLEEAIIEEEQALGSLKDDQVQLLNPAEGEAHDPHIEFAETSYDLSSDPQDDLLDLNSNSLDEMHPDYSIAPPASWIPLVRPPSLVGPGMTSSGTTQRQFPTLLTPSMMALQCGLSAIQHYTYPRGTLVPFQTLRNLGRGSMAHVEEVYIPPHQSFVRKTFLLMMRSDLRLQCRDIIHREIQVMSRLTHMHIVKVIGSYDLEPITSTILMFPVGDSDLKMFFEDFLDIPGGTGEWSKRRHWLRKWVGCLTSAITYIHGQGICHKDIKPSNIVYKGDSIYLTDFSSCGQFHIGGTTSTAADARTTLMYRAPELFRTGDAGKHGPGTDVFALGLVFLEMETVYWGTSIQRLREIYAAAASVKSSDHREFYYGKALVQIHEELERNTDRGDNQAWPLSPAVILSMLAFERKERPRAVQVLSAIHFEYTHDSCVCTMSNAASDI